MEKNMRIWVWVIVAVVVVVAVVLIFAFNNKQIAIQTLTTEPSSVQDIASTDIGAAAAPIAYADALVKYADRRIQLDKTCQAHPNTVTYKDNTGIMIDNRSAQARTVKVGTTFTIKPWGFKIVVLPDTYLTSKTILVDCGQYQNVATVLVQE
jgi:hypothetical protein